MDGTLLTMYGISCEIQTAAPSTMSPLCAGIDNLAEALNEVVQQYFFLCDNGFARNHVTGMAPAYTFTGRRVIGDAAQDFIFGLKYKVDTERQSQLRITYSTGQSTTNVITCPVTICNIQEFSGATTDDSAISFELRFDSAPSAAPGEKEE